MAVDLFDNRLELARRCGATETISGPRRPVVKASRSFEAGGPDVFIDNTGNPEVISRGYDD